MEKLTVEISHWPNNSEGYKYYAKIPDMTGMGESGNTKLEAFEELMISLKVKIAFDNNINLK